MDLRPAMDEFRAAWSDAHVCRMARDFLAGCGWELEADDDCVRILPDAELHVYSRAAVMQDHGFGDHLEAIVYIGVERSPPNLWPIYGVLRLYLDAAGRMISEDRYSVDDWCRRN